MLRLLTLTPLDAKKMTEENSAAFEQNISTAKSVLQKIVPSSAVERASLDLLVQSLEITPKVIHFCCALSGEEPTDFASNCDLLRTRLKEFTDLLTSTWSSIVDGSPILCGLAAPDHFGRLMELSFFMSRLAIPFHVVLTMWSRVYPARMRPKASELQKTEHSDVRAQLRLLLQALKDIFARYEQIGSKDSLSVSPDLELLQPGSLPAFNVLALPASDAKRIIDHVKETTIASLKDSLVNFSLAAKEKLKDLSSCKF
jgi:hypothetical protein